MRILHVINKLSFDGGPSITVPRLYQELEKLGHEVRVATAQGGFNGGRAAANDIRWADVIHLTGVYNTIAPFTLWLCRHDNKPLIWSPRGAWQRFPGSRKVWMKRLWDALCRRLAPAHTVIHATSELEAQSVMAVMPFPIRVIANGVDVPEELLEREPSEGLRVLYLGRLDRKKGIEKLIAAMASIAPESGIRLSLVGDGDPLYVDTLKRLAKHCPHVRFRGHCPHAQLPYVFQEHDVTIVPSEIESFGQVVVESLAHGVPVIASTGVPFVLHAHGCGVTVPMDSPPIVPLLDFAATKQCMPWLLTAMGTAGRNWVLEEFKWEDKAKEMIAAYQYCASLVSADTSSN